MKKIFFNLLFLFLSVNVYSQSKKANPFQRVSVPDTIVKKLEKAYSKNGTNVNAGRNVFNLSNRQKFVFGDGIYSFQGQGPHFPRRIFIYNKGGLFIFDNEGAFNPKGVDMEFAACVKSLHLTKQQHTNYSKIVATYLEQEKGNTYGAEIE